MLKRNVVAALGLAAAILAGCAAPPDTTLHPSPPLVHYAPLQHPFREATLAVDRSSAAAQWQRTHEARWLDPITPTAQARWVNGPADIQGAASFAETTAAPKGTACCGAS